MPLGELHVHRGVEKQGLALSQPDILSVLSGNPITWWQVFIAGKKNG